MNTTETKKARASLSFEQYAKLRDWSLENIDQLRPLRATEHANMAQEALGFSVSPSTVRDLRQANNIHPIEVPKPDFEQMLLQMHDRIVGLERHVASLDRYVTGIISLEASNIQTGTMRELFGPPEPGPDPSIHEAPSLSFE